MDDCEARSAKQAGMRAKRRADEVAAVELDGEIVLYDERTQTVHHLNPQATIVWKLCDGSSTVDELACALADAADADPAVVSRDVRGVIDELVAAGLVLLDRSVSATR